VCIDCESVKRRTKDHTARDRLRCKLARLKAQRPNGIGARQVYVKDLIELATQQQKDGRRQFLRRRPQLGIMARSHVGFEQLSEPAKQYYEKQVGALQAEAENAKASDIAECQEQLA
jgi:hypothetical protein